MLYVSIGYLGAHLGLGIPNDEGLYAINPDGTQNWSMITSHYLNEGHDHHYMDTFSPAIASDGTIYVGSWSNTFYAFAGPLPAPTITAFGPSSGPVGTSVAITGTGFTGATEVRFGSAAATGFTVDSATQISAIVPPDAVSGTIVVTTPTGSATSTASFTPTGFADVPQSHRYALAIYDLAKRRIISGYGTGSFGPGDPVVRQQFAKMLDLSLGLTVTEGGATMPFVDVERPANNLYPDDFVAFAYQNHLVEGKDPTHFQPYVEITRAQVMTMIVRAAKGFKTSAATQPPAGWQGTLNASDPTHGANIAVAEYNGLLAGIDLGGWNIWGNATRGEVAQIMWNLREK
jgi:IPT/TIG domain./S-layer homology domain.